MTETPQADIQPFIDRWQASGAAERANYQLFLTELCALIRVDHPQPATEDPHKNAYIFEKQVPSAHGTANFIDLYKRGCFVLEAKQGSDQQATHLPLFSEFSEAALQRRRQRKTGTAVRGTKGWDTAMEKARQQAQTYARSLPAEEIVEGRPPFLVTVDVGNTIALYSEFSRTGGNYIPFPDPSTYRLKLDDLHDANVRQLLRQVWDDPMSLDPSRRSARVTRTIAARLAELAKSLEGRSHPETVAVFLMRCLFTMFAEDVGLLPARSFAQLLADIRQDPASFKPMMEHLWTTMNAGGFSVILRRQIPQFNGGLFADPTALALDPAQIELLAEAAQADWRDVEPAIFGTLLERALDPVERHKLGAHYTPRAYVERLVMPTIIEPLRAEWASVQTAALLLADSGQTDEAIGEVEAFHRRLATLRILDPACGSGNFLYVTLEHLKRLEGEVLNTLQELGPGQIKLAMSGVTVSPQQFLGIEVNPRAAAIAELVLWIGYLQWHHRTEGDTPYSEPIIRNYHNIECRDAVLAWDRVEPLLDEDGQPVTRWDGRTTKLHPITGEAVPDDTARIPAYKYINPRPAEWPEADFIVGNPPFVGDKTMREALGDGYVDAIRKAYVELPQSIDFVMYWWDKAANLVRQGRSQRAGLITTNSVKQAFNRRVMEKHLNATEKPLSLIFAIPDHPWVNEAGSANVRIAMTISIAEIVKGKLLEVIHEDDQVETGLNLVFSESVGFINSNVTVGARVTDALPLKAGIRLHSNGMMLAGRGFILTKAEAVNFGYEKDSSPSSVIFPIRNGRDLNQSLRDFYVIDLFGYDIEEVKAKYPDIYQHLFLNVKPERDQNRRKKMREQWWIFAEPRKTFRSALKGLKRYIATVETSKHRTFQFLDSRIVPEHKLIAFAIDDAHVLGVLSSRVHVTWAVNAGGRLGVGNDPVYVKTKSFDPFPFPAATDDQKARIRALGEQLDAHRKRQQAQHPTLTLTDMYNVLEKVRAGDPLSPKEKTIHEQGLVSILAQIHDELDAAVFAAYAWPADLSDEEILQRLVDLNAERAGEEAAGHIRWLCPDYQAPGAVQHQQAALVELEDEPAAPVLPAQKQPWPATLKERATAVRAALSALAGSAGIDDVVTCFDGRHTQKRREEVGEILEMLAALGQIREEDARFFV